MTALRTETLPDISALTRRSADIAGLCSAVGAPVTARWPWLDAWARTHTSWRAWGVAVDDVSVPEGHPDRLAAVALLARRRRGPILEIVALGHGMSDYARLPARDGPAAAALACGVADALGRLRGPWRLRLEQLPTDDPVLTALAGRLPHAVLLAGDGAPVLDLPADGSAPAVGRRARAAANKGRNRLARDDRKTEHLTTGNSDEVAGLLPEVARVRRSRDHAVRGDSDLDRPESRRFWHTVLREGARRGEVEITTMAVDGELAAYSIALLDGDAYRIWDPRFLPGLGYYNPGYVLHTELLPRLAQQGRWTSFDWMRGEEPYKNAMSTRIEPAERLRAWSSSWLRTSETVARRAHAETLATTSRLAASARRRRSPPAA